MWRFSRSSGPGGQHVNTSDSQVELRFDLASDRGAAAGVEGAGAGAARGPAGRRGGRRTRLRAPLAVAQPRDGRGPAGRAARGGDGAAAQAAPGDEDPARASTSAGCGRRSSARETKRGPHGPGLVARPRRATGSSAAAGPAPARAAGRPQRAGLSPAGGSGPGSTSAGRRPRSAGPPSAPGRSPGCGRPPRPAAPCGTPASPARPAPAARPRTSPRVYGMSSNSSRSLTRPFIAKRPAMCRWLSERTETRPQRLLGEQVVHAGAVAQADQHQRRVQGHRHERGRRHADVLAARAVRRRGSCAVTSTTPAASRDMAARNSSLLTPSAWGMAIRARGGGVVCNTRGTLVSAVRRAASGQGTSRVLGLRRTAAATRRSGRPAAHRRFAFRKARERSAAPHCATLHHLM